MRAIPGLLATILIAACASRPTLPTLPSDGGGCRDVGLNAVLAGDPADPRVAWLVDRGGEGRQDIIWPPGFDARFTPGLEILDASATVVYKAGDAIHGGCVAGPPDDPSKLLLIRPGY